MGNTEWTILWIVSRLPTALPERCSRIHPLKAGSDGSATEKVDGITIIKNQVTIKNRSQYKEP